MIPHTCVKNAYKMVVSILVPTGYTEPSSKLYLQLNITANIVEGNYLLLFYQQYKMYNIYCNNYFHWLLFTVKSTDDMSSFCVASNIEFDTSNSQLTSESSNTIPLFLNDGKYWYGNIISCCWHYGMDYALSMDFLSISIYVNAYFKFLYNCKSQHMNVRSNISFHYAIYYTSYINYHK